MTQCTPKLQVLDLPGSPRRLRCITVAGASACTRRKLNCVHSAPNLHLGERIARAARNRGLRRRGASRASPSGLQSRRNGVGTAFERINGGNRYRLLTMTRQHLYQAILRSAQRTGIDTNKFRGRGHSAGEAVLQLADGRSFPADLVIAADGVRSSCEPLGLIGDRRKYQDGIIRVLVERAGFVGGAWDHVIDMWAFEPRLASALRALRSGPAIFCHDGSRDDAAAASLPVNPAIWASCFPSLGPAFKTIESRGSYGIYETTRLKSWSVGRVAIIGIPLMPCHQPWHKEPGAR